MVRSIAVSPRDYNARVVRVNQVPVPSKKRARVELEGRWPNYEPMSQGDFVP